MTARRLTISLIAPVVLLFGCVGSDKVTGARTSVVKTLTIANANDSQIELQPWLDEVRALSKGRLQIRVINNWRLGQPGFESGLIADVRGGRVQFGWVATRALTAAGVHSFDALNVPFTVDSCAAET